MRISYASLGKGSSGVIDSGNVDPGFDLFE